jgi:plasmid stabilization system protein ParE
VKPLYRVEVSSRAREDIARLMEFIFERELASAAPDPFAVDHAITAIEAGFATLARFPMTCRKAGASPFVRELLISFGATGYVALFEILDERTVVVGAVRHQREDDFH